MIHDFARSLRQSQEAASAPWWEPVYRTAFPDLASMSYVGDSPLQRDGVDRVIVTKSGHVHLVDEKVRSSEYPDVLLEYWSDEEKRRPGWVAKELACDYIAYAFAPTGFCYLLPFALLRRAWRIHGRDWVRMGRLGRDGFRLVEARNRGGWTSRSVAVPVDELLDAIKGASLVNVGVTDRRGCMPEAGTS